MKKLFLSAVCLAAVLTATASPVTKEQARQQAASFLMKKNGARRMPAKDVSLRLTDAADIANGAVYTFNVDNGAGFVVVSGDDRTPAILGYADHGAVSQSDMPDNMRAWLDNYAQQIALLDSKAAAPRHTVQGTAIEPLLTTQWGQGAPYNLQTPFFPDSEVHTSTGCVATAMAQVMYYHQWPKQTNTIEEYSYYEDGTEQWLSVAQTEPTTLEWANMLTVYSDDATEVQQQAVATLMRACGAAVKMDYDGVSLSYTQDVVGALVDCFSYSYGTRFVSRSDGYTTAQWNQLIYDELAAKRPVVYGGSSVGGGHAFVIDGYSSDDYFHVNWGWYGDCDGNFLLSILDPDSNSGTGASTSTDGYSFWQDAIIGIEPRTDDSGIGSLCLTTTKLKVWNDEHEFDLINDDRFALTYNLINRTPVNGWWYLSLAFTDEQGNIVSRNFKGNPDAFSTEIYHLEEQSHTGEYYWKDFSTAPGFDAATGYQLSLPDGTYRLVMCSHTLQDEDGSMNINKGMDEHFATAVVSNGKLTLTWSEQQEAVDLDATLELVGDPIAGVKPTVRATIVNNGDDYTQDIFIFADGTLKGGRPVGLAAGETAVIDFTVDIDPLGDVEFALGDYNAKNILATLKVTFLAPEVTLNLLPEVKYATDEIIGTRQAFFNFHIENTGSTDFDQMVLADVYKQADDGLYYWCGNATARAQVAAGQQGDIEVVYDNVEDGANYFFYAYYFSGSGYVQGYEYTPFFSVRFTPADIAIVPGIGNASDSGEEWIRTINDDKAILTMEVTNHGTTDYNNIVMAKVYKQAEDGLFYHHSWVRTPVSVAAGATAAASMVFDQAEEGATYFYYAYYVSDGNEVVGCDWFTPAFTFSGTTVGISDMSVGSACQQGAVYSLDGRQLRQGQDQLRQLPKGIYIVNGKKVRN